MFASRKFLLLDPQKKLATNASTVAKKMKKSAPKSPDVGCRTENVLLILQNIDLIVLQKLRTYACQH